MRMALTGHRPQRLGYSNITYSTDDWVTIISWLKEQIVSNKVTDVYCGMADGCTMRDLCSRSSRWRQLSSGEYRLRGGDSDIGTSGTRQSMRPINWNACAHAGAGCSLRHNGLQGASGWPLL